MSRQLTKFEILSDIQAIPFEINMRKKKWFFLCIYKPPSMNSKYFLGSLSNIIDYYSSVYDSHTVIGDFNLELSQIHLETFMETHNYFNHYFNDIKSSLNNCNGNFDEYEKSLYQCTFLILTAIWLSHGQLWAILKGAASLTRCESLCLYKFDPKVIGSLATRLDP